MSCREKCAFGGLKEQSLNTGGLLRAGLTVLEKFQVEPVLKEPNNMSCIMYSIYGNCTCAVVYMHPWMFLQFL